MQPVGIVLTRDTPDPKDGMIARDATGAPYGISETRRASFSIQGLN